MEPIEKLLKNDRPFLTDGGFETWLFFQQGFEAPEFAAIMLMENENAQRAMRSYFEEFFKMAESAKTGFVLDTNTWRGCTKWADSLGVSQEDLLTLSKKAVTFASNLKAEWQHRVSPILVNGVIGPSGDGYSPDQTPDPVTAEKLHTPQMKIFAESEVDMVSALTITNIDEAIGITNAAKLFNLPIVISFTVEINGCIPTGQSLGEAIKAVDEATNNSPIYYMVNCAHPDHFGGSLKTDADWLARIGGLRANASRMTHEELDNSEVLDEGNPEEFGLLHNEIAKGLDNLHAIGGCCGTDHRHIKAIAGHLLA